MLRSNPLLQINKRILSRAGKETGLHSIVLYTRSREPRMGRQILSSLSPIGLSLRAPIMGYHSGVDCRQIPPELNYSKMKWTMPSLPERTYSVRGGVEVDLTDESISNISGDRSSREIKRPAAGLRRYEQLSRARASGTRGKAQVPAGSASAGGIATGSNHEGY